MLVYPGFFSYLHLGIKMELYYGIMELKWVSFQKCDMNV